MTTSTVLLSSIINRILMLWTEWTRWLNFKRQWLTIRCVLKASSWGNFHLTLLEVWCWSKNNLWWLKAKNTRMNTNCNFCKNMIGAWAMRSTTSLTSMANRFCITNFSETTYKTCFCNDTLISGEITKIQEISCQ